MYTPWYVQPQLYSSLSCPFPSPPPLHLPDPYPHHSYLRLLLHCPPSALPPSIGPYLLSLLSLDPCPYPLTTLLCLSTLLPRLHLQNHQLQHLETLLSARYPAQVDYWEQLARVGETDGQQVQGLVELVGVLAGLWGDLEWSLNLAMAGLAYWDLLAQDPSSRVQHVQALDRDIMGQLGSLAQQLQHVEQLEQRVHQKIIKTIYGLVPGHTVTPPAAVQSIAQFVSAYLGLLSRLHISFSLFDSLHQLLTRQLRLFALAQHSQRLDRLQCIGFRVINIVQLRICTSRTEFMKLVCVIKYAGYLCQPSEEAMDRVEQLLGYAMDLGRQMDGNRRTPQLIEDHLEDDNF